MKGFRVIKDMIVDMEPFFAKYKSLKPFLVNDEPVTAGNGLQSPKARARYDDTTKCILCGACTTSLPFVLGGPDLCGARGHCERPPVYL
jgi:succinate dehydrogenase / fumarate reductase iron-sulfur subunit